MVVIQNPSTIISKVKKCKEAKRGFRSLTCKDRSFKVEKKMKIEI